MAAADAITKLHTMMIDTRNAYTKAAEEAETPELKAFFAGMVTLRQQAHDELHKVLDAMNMAPDEGGSLMTTVHRTIIGVRSAVAGIDESSLSAFERGEQNTLEQYDSALSEPDLRPETAAILRRQKAELSAKLHEMKGVEDAKK